MLIARQAIVGFCLCFVCTVAAFCQPELTAGDWSATVGPTGPSELCYKGEVIARRGNLGAWHPAWKGGRFVMDGAEVTAAEASATWHKAVPENQEATLKLLLTPQGCRFSLDTTITAAGPSEFSLQLVPEAVRTAEDRCFVWVDEEPRVLSLVGVFDKFGGIADMRFERPDRTVFVRCNGFEMQDRRAGGSGLFLVQVIGSSGREPRTKESFIEIGVREADAADVAGRERLLAQRPTTYEPMTVRNGGFESEKPLERWSENPRATLDAEVKHEGDRSARLTILPGEEKDANPYITQTIPVTEGRLYEAEAWIKAEDVEAAAVRGMPSTGATIIIEFNDKQGKWFASGSYAKGSYGTSNWRRVMTGVARAPKGAGSAVIFLALRATGTAWFDDVGLREVRRHAMMLSPLPGERVADNTPRFNWYYGAKTSTVLELSQTEDFAADEVISMPNVQTLPISLETPIAPGTWFWRVRAPDFAYTSPAWQFVQTASLDQDCTEPKIEETHGFLAARTDAIRVRYSDNVGVQDVRLTVDGKDASESAKAGETELTYAPKEGWTEGLHKVAVEVKDEAGNRAERKLFFTHCRPMPTTVWRQIGGVETLAAGLPVPPTLAAGLPVSPTQETRGEKRFLFGMYGVRIEDMPEVAEAGFDFVHNYTWDGTGTNETAIEYLDEAQKHGLQAFIGISRRQLMKGDEEFVAERVGALMGHPGLLAWYLYDEPDLAHQYVSPMWLERYYRLIKALDPFHPVVVTCAGDGAVAEYRNALDVHWTQVYGSTSFVARRLPKHRASLNEGTPLAAILHCYDRTQTTLLRAGKPTDPAEFQPDGRTMRANAFMALTKNASCLIWWWWGQGGSFTVANAPEAWASLKQTVADIKSLEPVLTAEGEIHTWVEKPAEGVEVHVWEKKLAGRTVIIAVNRDNKACEVSIAPKTLPKNCSMQDRFEDRQVEVKDGLLRDDFEPLGVHVYQWEAGG